MTRPFLSKQWERKPYHADALARHPPAEETWDGRVRTNGGLTSPASLPRQSAPALAHPAIALAVLLSASASYIVVPAVPRHASSEVTPSLYFVLSLGITAPLNMLVGIPLCIRIARLVLPTR
jgi:hypothetical protein